MSRGWPTRSRWEGGAADSRPSAASSFSGEHGITSGSPPYICSNTLSQKSQ